MIAASERVVRGARSSLPDNRSGPRPPDHPRCPHSMTARLATTWVSGQQLGPTVVAQPQRHAVMGIRLLPAGAYALFGAPLRVVTGVIVELEDLIGPSGREVVDRCREAPSVEERFRIAAAWLATRLARARAPDPASAWAAG